jgi:hypothetical protein
MQLNKIYTKLLKYIIYIVMVTRSQWLVLLLFITLIVIIPAYTYLFMERVS